LQKLKDYTVVLVGILLIVLVCNQIFGNALALRGGLKSHQQTSSETSTTQQTHQTQLEVGGSQTAQIRTIVWSGALETFKHYPLFGSGLETFGYSYYLFRPAAHNYTTEWDFLYNKAHNEFLNYLSTTGAVGFLTYLLFIGAFEYFAIRTLVKMKWGAPRFLGLGILSGFNTALGANFFGFSVVPTNLLFFTFPVFFFLTTDSLGEKLYKISFEKNLSFLKNNLNNNIAKVLVAIISFSLFLSVVGYWIGDFLYSKSFGATDYQKSVRYLRTAVKLAPYEPVYRIELASNLASLAGAINEEDKNSEEVKTAAKEAQAIIDDLAKEHPNDTSLWQNKKGIDYDLAKIDPKNNDELLITAETLKRLAPTDASIQYDVALVYLYLDKNQHAQQQLEKVVALKNDYRDAVLALARTEIKNKNNDAASKLLQDWIKKNPADSEAEDLLKSLLTS
ncbi:MAG TPA: O-antigen ligase family protein, partial [Candidatus Saccharimonadales bacterium]|nr:O-antigen ligase family protein [Candidatus Saccharimonadales bacterium]